MYWKDEGYLLSKNNFNENSIIIQAFTAEHGNCSGIVYGGASRKQKRIFQIGNKVLLNWKSKGENNPGYFNVEIIQPIGPRFFDDKKRSICILSAVSILRILLPERQRNKKIYHLFEKLIEDMNKDEWIKSYIFWEINLIKELGFEIESSKNIKKIEINGKYFTVPKIFFLTNDNKCSNEEFSEALSFNSNLLIENFIAPNKLRFPSSRNLLEKYFK